jgi:hypothetical protein
MSWQTRRKDSKPDIPPTVLKDLPRSDKPSDPRISGKRQILRRPNVAEANRASARVEAVASAVATLRGAQTERKAAVESRGSGCLLAFALLGVALLAWLVINPMIAVPGIALTFSAFFLMYALKYYISIGQVLTWSNGAPNGNGSNGLGQRTLTSEIKKHTYLRPFISIHLPIYNEAAVIDRLLEACTSLDYPHYEVIVADA